MKQRGNGWPGPAGELHAAPGITQPGGNDPRLRMSLGIIEQLSQGVRRDGGIVIEEEQVTAARCPGRLVIGPGEARVAGVPDQDHLGKLASHHVGGTVCRGIVDDNHLLIHSLLVPQK